GKHVELIQEFNKILKGERVVEWLVPGIELDLGPCGERNDGAEPGSKQNELIAARRNPESLHHHPHLRRKVVFCCPFGPNEGRFFCLLIHIDLVTFLSASI